MSDMLKDIFNGQTALEKLYGRDKCFGCEMGMEGMTNVGKMICDNATYMTQELAELRDSFYYKHWYAEFRTGKAFHPRPKGIHNAKVEVVDLLHFLMGIAVHLGMTAEEIHSFYIQKNQINQDRFNTNMKQEDRTEVENKGIK